MQKYRKKPVVIEAMKFNGMSNAIECIDFTNKTSHALSEKENGVVKSWHLIIPTLEGSMTANVGDYIIKGIKGEFYPCKPDIFEATYELVQD